MDFNALISAPLTRDDFRELATRQGRKSATPTDAMRYGALCMRLTPLLKRHSPSEPDVGVFATKLQVALKLLPEGAPSALLRASVALSAAERERIFEGLVAPLLALQGNSSSSAPPIKEPFVMEPIFLAPECATCASRSGELLKCGKCRSVLYCSVACQRAHWKAHKGVCVPVHTEVAAAGAPQQG